MEIQNFYTKNRANGKVADTTLKSEIPDFKPRRYTRVGVEGNEEMEA